MASKKLVLVVGASGNTGRGVTKALLEDGNFRVAMLVRPQSVNNAAIQEFAAAGAEIRVGDATDAPESLEAALKGVDVLILMILAFLGQEPILKAAKAVGVGRVIPSDFGPTAPKGVMDQHDVKLGVREYIKDIGLSYTFVEAGAWLWGMLPPLHATKESMFTPKLYVGDRNTKIMFTSIPTISRFLVKIIDDDRTLNQTVVIPDGEATIKEIWSVASKITGEDFSDYPRLPDEAVLAQINSDKFIERVVGQMMNSVFLRGDNTVEAALASGAIDARRLFPDVHIIKLEEGTKEFYKNPPPVPNWDL